MSHSIIIQDSLFKIFDPDDAEYAGVRQHFSNHELQMIDTFRAYPPSHVFTIAEKSFAVYVLTKAIFTMSDPGG